MFDSSGVNTSTERCHGIVELVTPEGLVLVLGGTKQGQRYTIPHNGELLPLPGGSFYLPESNEWIHPAFFHEAEIRPCS